MNAVRPPDAVKIGVALMISAGVLLLQWLLWDFIAPDAWALSYAAVLLATVVGGRIGGLAATALCFIVVCYFFISPVLSFAIADISHLASALIFAATAVALCLLLAHLQLAAVQRDQARREIAQMNRVLDQRVQGMTAQLQASNEALLTNQRHLQAIVENLGYGVVLVDSDGQMLFLNQTALTMMGLRSAREYQRMAADFADTYELTLLDGTLLSVDQWPIMRMLRGEKVDEIDVCLTHIRKGWRRHLRLRGSRVHNSAAQQQVVVMVMEDITDNRRRETRFEALIEHSCDSIVLLNSDNLMVYLSPAVTAVEGYLPEELVGRSGIENVHPDDVAAVHETLTTSLENPGNAFPILLRRRHRQGHWLWLEGVAINLLHEPAVRAIVINYRDVSERIYQQEKIRSQLTHLALLDQITRAIAEHQGLQNVLQVVLSNLETGMPLDFCCVLFVEPGKALLRVESVGTRSAALASVLQLEAQQEVPMDNNGLASCMSGRLVYDAELDGNQFPFCRRLHGGGLNSLVMVPLRAEEGVMGLLVCARSSAASFSSSDCEFLRQLSEHTALAINQTRLYGALQQAYDELHLTQAAIMQEERLRVLGQMASGIAHDINNALTPMLLYTELLLESEAALSTRGRQHLEIVRRSVYDVSQTVVRLRDFARPHDTASPMRRVRVNPLVKQVIDLAQVRWHDMALEHGRVIKVATELQPELPEIEGVESEIREALTNLIINAVDAMPDGGTLTLRTRMAEGSQPPRVLVEVGDSGVGMNEQTRQRCLEPFFTTKGAQGTGLGLAMVFGMSKRHAATFDIDSAPGEGTTMRIGFLVASICINEVERTAVAVTPPPLKLLVIDDDPILLNSLSEVLGADGHDVVTAGGGKEGLSLFKVALDGPAPFDAVITDLGMPYMDGRQLAGWVKRASPQTPVLLLTGWGQRLLEEEDIPPEVDKVLAKPPMLPLVRAALVELCVTRKPAARR